VKQSDIDLLFNELFSKKIDNYDIYGHDENGYIIFRSDGDGGFLQEYFRPDINERHTIMCVNAIFKKYGYYLFISSDSRKWDVHFWHDNFMQKTITAETFCLAVTVSILELIKSKTKNSKKNSKVNHEPK
jgi:hypothetical protein